MSRIALLLCVPVIACTIIACSDNTIQKIPDRDALSPDNTTVTDQDELLTDTDGTIAPDDDEAIPDTMEDKDTIRPDEDTIDAVCVEHWDCSEGMFCRRNVGACAGPGVCALMPPACDEVWAPVCGCDGATYPNECAANAGGHNVAYDGECQPGKTCLDATDCDQGQFCQSPPGLCGAQGNCLPYPDNECGDEVEILCGCDGTTYTNRCQAQMHGAGIAHAGPCGSMVACTENKQCTETEYCAKKTGECAAEAAGNCDLRPVDCDLISELMLVCGCDNITYNHPCHAAANGVNIAAPGPCESDNLCLNNDDCAEKELCQKAEGVCGQGPGSCELRPEACPMAYGAEICGCDGNTYFDECNAHAAGMNVAFSGSCESAIPNSILTYTYKAGEPPTIAAYARVWGSPNEGLELYEGTVVDKVNTNPTSILLRIGFGNFSNPAPGQESVIVQLAIPRTADVPYTANVDGGTNYVRWIDAMGNTKFEFLGTVNITTYETDNDFPNYTLTDLEFAADALRPQF